MKKFVGRIKYQSSLGKNYFLKKLHTSEIGYLHISKN